MRVLAALVVLGVGATYSGVFDPTAVPELFTQMLTGGVLFSFALSAYLYASSFAGKKLLAAGGDTGNRLYDFFIGRELNPRCAFLRCLVHLAASLASVAGLTLTPASPPCRPNAASAGWT